MYKNSIENDIKKVLKIIEGAGIKKLVLFGSCIKDPTNAHDIDIALSGVPKGMFFRLMGRLIKEVESPIDVVDMDIVDSYLQKRITEEGKILYEPKS